MPTMTHYSLDDLFKAVDTDGNGVIDRTELTQLLQENNMSLSSVQFQQLMLQIDVDGDGTINLSEFKRLIKSLNPKW